MRIDAFVAPVDCRIFWKSENTRLRQVAQDDLVIGQDTGRNNEQLVARSHQSGQFPRFANCYEPRPGGLCAVLQVHHLPADHIDEARDALASGRQRDVELSFD